jgi:hypothetical protein
MVRGCLVGRMVGSIRGSIRIQLNMGMGSIGGQMVLIIKDCGRLVSNMDRLFIRVCLEWLCMGNRVVVNRIPIKTLIRRI